jgi:hypothetical protein
MKGENPKFSKGSELARFVDEEHRGSNGRPSPQAFRRKDPGEELSVNTTEIHTLKQIADTYSRRVKGATRPIAISNPTVAVYNENAGKVLKTKLRRSKERWVYTSGSDEHVAYVYSPVTKEKCHVKVGDASHCEIAYTKHFDEKQDFEFARLMAQKPKFDLFP